jgi:hypothetical protein
VQDAWDSNQTAIIEAARQHVWQWVISHFLGRVFALPQGSERAVLCKVVCIPNLPYLTLLQVGRLLSLVHMEDNAGALLESGQLTAAACPVLRAAVRGSLHQLRYSC